MSKSRVFVASLLVPIIAFFSIPTASSHTTLLSSSPVAESLITEWPTEVKLEFAEDLQTFSAGTANFIEVIDSSGNQFNEKTAVVSGATITSKLLPNSTFGIFTVKYRVVAQDGHVLEDSYTFNFDGSKGAVTTLAHDSTGTPSQYPYRGIAAFLILAALVFGVIVYRKNEKKY